MFPTALSRGAGRHVHFKGFCVLMKACVSVGELAEALTLPVPYTAFGRSSAHDADATENGEHLLLSISMNRNPRYHLYQGHFLL